MPTPLSRNMRGPEVQELQKALRSIGLHIPEYEFRDSLFGAGTAQAVEKLQAARGLTVTGAVDAATAAELAAVVAANPADAKPAVEGQVLLDADHPAEGLRLRLYAYTPDGQVKRIG